eukprot:TRINITY_DN64026_c0_g1_i1.p1 TRINITY_DN64026_c0_g1~~TRINITY_DN64026_c0_g1_i1.p1  ORF type:complete len:480 (+),score=60.07 TRINITY_DN64026_c0_g1_i1:65-1504(+)
MAPLVRCHGICSLAGFAAILLRPSDLALAQVCRTSGAKEDGICGGNVLVSVPMGELALWASSLVPKSCDELQGQQCNWPGAADAWTYALNCLSQAMKSAGSADRGWLPFDSVSQLRGFIGQMGSEPGMWYGNWATAAGPARQLLDQMRPWLKTSAASFSLPKTNIGTHFPTLGRSVSIPTDGDMSTTVSLANGYSMPVLGFGVWQIPADGTTYQTVKWALELGYRHIDTAQAYGNEHEVGRAMRDSGVPRSEICLVTKLSLSSEYRVARQRFEQQLITLGVDYIDVYMLHSPGGSAEDRKQAWGQLEQLYEEGKIKALGVSNFNVDLLQELLGFAKTRPVYIQNKYSIYQPGNQDEALKGESLMEWLAREQIVMTGYSIIHPGHGGYLAPLEDPIVKSIAGRHGRTASQVLHRWLLQLGAAVIPRSTKRERIRENGDLFSFSLPETDMRLLNGIASLLKSFPGSRSPKWCDDVYGVAGL